jgi:hypothetical protein
MSAQDCLNLPATNPTIRMDYNSEQQGAQFYTVYQKRANVYGDTAYYQRCEIGNVLN